MPRYTFAFFTLLAGGVCLASYFQSDRMAIAQAPAQTPASLSGAKPSDGGSYIVGLQIGSSLRQGGFNAEDLKRDDFFLGVMDALKDVEPRLSQEEMTAAAKQLETKMISRMENAAKDNLTASQKFLEENKAKDGVQTLPSGLQYLEIKKGDGAQPKLTSQVKVHYEGKLINGQVFDSSIQRGEPASFGVNQVIPGWTEALQRMRVGDKWRIFIPSDLAYGSSGAGEMIGPNQALIFEVELLDVQQ